MKGYYQVRKNRGNDRSSFIPALNIKPMAEVTHIPATVIRSFTVPLFNYPSPKNLIPVTTCAVTLPGS